MSYRSIIFDLDGTLIDQFSAIHRAFSQVIVDMGYDRPTFDTVKKAIGGASESTMAKLIGPDRAKEAVEKLRPIFEKVMFEHWIEDQTLSLIPTPKLLTKIIGIKYAKHCGISLANHLSYFSKKKLRI